MSEHVWRQIARVLYSALRAHRADMHQTSSRPCPTCRQSAAAIKEYDEAVNKDRAQQAAGREPGEQ